MKLIIILIGSVLCYCGLFKLTECVSATFRHVEGEGFDKNGFWDKKLTWKSHWVKSWTTKTYYVPVWRKVWGPIVKNEWIPLPEPLATATVPTTDKSHWKI